MSISCPEKFGACADVPELEKALSTESTSIIGALAECWITLSRPTCKERGINARITDEIVWRKIVELMSSKTLMLKQVERWASGRRCAPQGPEVDNAAMRQELARLKKQEERYTSAYADGLFSIAKLHEYIDPLRVKIAAVEVGLANVQGTNRDSDDLLPPEQGEIEAFAIKAAKALMNLKFEEKRAIVISVIDRVVASQEQVKVHVTNHVELCSEYRDRVDAIRHGFPRRCIKLIPFDIVIPLPPPLKRGVDYGFLPGSNVSNKG